MWLPNPPAIDEELRQGDLIVGIPFPKTATVKLTPKGFGGDVDDDVTAVVLDHCCNIEQKHVLLLGRVTSRGVNERMLATLTSVDARPGQPYSRYMHLLEPHAELRPKKDRRSVINMLDRVQLFGESKDDLSWLRERRVARMNVVARGHLRLKLAVLFGRVEEETDAPELKARGLDTFGRPEPRVYRGVPPSG